ncbi:hypothetical protein [Priestia aryabhattai]
MSMFGKILGSFFRTRSNHLDEEGEELCYCDNCNCRISISEYIVRDSLCQTCYDDKYESATPSWIEQEDYGQDADYNGICDHCGKSRKYQNCTCW